MQILAVKFVSCNKQQKKITESNNFINLNFINGNFREQHENTRPKYKNMATFFKKICKNYQVYFKLFGLSSRFDRH